AAKAAEEATLRAAAEAKATDEARTAAAARARAQAEEAARAKADAKLKASEDARASAEATAAEQANLRAAAEAKAAEETKLRAAAEARAAEETKLRAAAETKAMEEARTTAEAKAAEVARATAEAIVAAAKAAEEATLRAAAEAKATDEARTAAAARARAQAEEAARAKADAEVAQAKTGNKRKSAKDSVQSVWFYTCEGDRLGPVSFEELKAMAAGSSLNPRLDMVWRQSMDAWKPAGQIDGLFERKSMPVEPKETLAPPAASIHPPQQGSRTPMAANVAWPGAHRRSLLLITLVFPFAWEYALNAISPLLVKQFGQALMGKILPAAPLVPLVVLVYFLLKRLMNLGMSRWWCLAVFAPILNLWVGYRCFACPAGYAYHKKMDGPGIALAILYWLIMLLAVLILAACVALLCGAIHSPALQEQLRVLIRIA
ncbi:MAG: DUF4339 domain-containing protein, partial [Verrucomicrobia bacterium]|nr:DUF4339 domain-containing protein [Verrucomicrobiota bacterium]